MKEYYDLLVSTKLFANVKKVELITLLKCLDGKFNTYENETTIYNKDSHINRLGIVLSGCVTFESADSAGNTLITKEFFSGDIFGASYTMMKKIPLEADIIAKANTTILTLNVPKILTICSSTCRFHNQVIHNLFDILAENNFNLTKKIEHLSKKTTREKLLAYLSSEAKRSRSSEFTIPYNRQELADYLCVDRSAMSYTLGKLKKEGILDFKKNSFSFKTSI